MRHYRFKSDRFDASALAATREDALIVLLGSALSRAVKARPDIPAEEFDRLRQSYRAELQHAKPF